MENTFDPIIKSINSSDSILLLVHENPDGDAIGSIVSMYLALKRLNKNVVAFIEKVPSNCEFLINSIGKDIKTFSEIDFSASYDLCVSLDCGDMDRMGDAKVLFKNAKATISIDHHYTNEGFADFNYIDEKAAATGELVYRLLKEMNFSIDTDIATSLYTAIASDTGNFKHNNTTKNTFEIAGELTEYGIDITKISYHLFSESSLNRMMFLGKLLQNIEVSSDGKLGIILATSQDIEEFSLEESELDGIVDYARNIKGVEVGLFIKAYKDYFKVSLRSNGKIEVASIASKFNGGGHKFAAGCKIRSNTIFEAKQMLLDAFAEIVGF